jgi:hypothetical protein
MGKNKGTDNNLSVRSSEAAPRKRVLVNGRGMPFDALAGACMIDTRNRTQVGRLTKALKDIRGYFAEEVGDAATTAEEFEGALARAIVARARLYQQRFPRAALTPTALSAWWHQLVVAEVQDAQARQQTRDLLDRMKRKGIGREGH